MKDAIAHVLNNYNYTLFIEGGNYTQFLTPENEKNSNEAGQD